MTQDPLEAEEIERVDPPDTERTTERDRAADWIEFEVVDPGRWPMTVTAMEEESKASDDEDVGWSRQHLRNTLSSYFRPAGSYPAAGESSRMEGTTAGVDGLAIPGHERELLEAYRLGFKDGFEEGRDAK